MKRSQLGVARVSMVWFISIIVLFFVACVVAFIAFDEGGKFQSQLDTVRADLRAIEQRADEDEARVQSISKAAGWYDRNSATAVTNTDTLAADLADLKATFPDLGPSVENVQDALPPIKQAYAARAREIADLEDQVAALQSEKDTVDTSLRSALAQKDTELADLRRQLDDSTASAAAQQSEKDARIASLRSQISEQDAEIRAERGKVEQEQRKYDDDLTTWETRFKEQGKKLRFLKEPSMSDGEVLAVSDDVGMGWIDLGAKHRLARGMRFQVVSGRIGSQETKAWAEVTYVSSDHAEVLFSDLADRFDPVVPGDIVFNPLYDPIGGRHAVLAGRFSVPNETEVRALLQNMGIVVQEGLDLTTDYLVVGSDLFVDQEGNQLEKPMPPSELPIYKNAEAQGVVITPIKDLRSYFKF